ncbi:MAG: dihydrofolate reductase family protein [Rhodothermales bacterium]|nr:dihydrofolate reductase family protein [Rhodothermales bacterium]MBO6781173.1 dihydrofolate reductase family protein [Rhodothermales bacterium]
MRKLVLSAAVSLDGFIAGPDGEIDWILMDPDIDFGELIGRFDALLVGRKSWEEQQNYGGGMFNGLDAWVISRTLAEDEGRGCKVSPDLAATVAELKASGGRDIWLFGGGDLFRSAFDLALVDEVQVAVIPVLLGGGLPLLPSGKRGPSLTLLRSRVFGKTGTVLLDYEVKR